MKTALTDSLCFADTMKGGGKVIAFFFPAIHASGTTELGLKIGYVVARRARAAADSSQSKERAASETSPKSSLRYIPVGRSSTQAREILKNAIQRYRRPDGYEGYLAKAAWQLELIGKDAWSALVEISKWPECEFFLGAMVRLEGVQDADRRAALLAVAQNRDQNVRSRLLELTDELPPQLRRELVIALTSDKNRDDGVTDRARHVLAALDS